MTIAEVRALCKDAARGKARRILLFLVILLGLMSSFGFGYVLGGNATSYGLLQQVAAPIATSSPLGEYVGARGGTTYYLPWCGAVGRIAPENIVWFSSATDAERQGYSAAKNCSGL